MFDGELTAYLADVFSKSGGVGVVVALIFFACVGIGLERVVFWLRIWASGFGVGAAAKRATEQRICRVERLLRHGKLNDAGEEAKQAGPSALRVLGEALAKLRCAGAWTNTRDRVMAETLGANVDMGRRFLIMAIQGFGLLGMLGTCKGLYAQLSSFGSAATGLAGMGSLQGAMGGMGEAFTTTLVGLTAAALTMLIYLPNEVAVERFKRQLRRFDARIQAALQEGGASSAPAAAALPVAAPAREEH